MWGQPSEYALYGAYDALDRSHGLMCSVIGVGLNPALCLTNGEGDDSEDEAGPVLD